MPERAAWTTFDDVARRYHRTIPDAQRAWVSALIDDAEDALSLVVADLADRIDTQAVPVERVKRIVAHAVIAVLRNPEGYLSESTSRGPFSSSVTRSAAAGAGGGRIVFPEEDLAALRPDVAPAASVALALPPWRVS